MLSLLWFSGLGAIMRTGLPANHGLPPELLTSSLLHRDELNQFSLTDVQFAALESGNIRRTVMLQYQPAELSVHEVPRERLDRNPSQR